MHFRKKQLICFAFFLALLIAFFSFINSVYLCFGYYKIEGTETNNGCYYFYIDHLGELVRLKCDKLSYDLVEATKESWFAIEFKRSNYFPRVGYVTQIQVDEVLTKSWG